MTQDNHAAECYVELIRTQDSAVVPFRAHGDGDSGFDLCAAGLELDYVIQPLSRVIIDTGWRISIQHGWEGQVRPRSGNALNKGLTVLNTPGTVDSSYDGALGVILFNSSNFPIRITNGMKIAQIVFQRVPSVDLKVVQTFSKGATSRGSNGYGSSGTHV